MNEGAPDRSRVVHALAWILPTALVVWQGLRLLTAPIPAVLDGTIPDDAFYYLVPARYIADTGFSTFDGLHFTNGYHPLWMAVCVVIAWFVPSGGEDGLRAVQFVQLAIAACAVALIARMLVRIGGAVIGGAAALYFLTRLDGPLMDGLETPLVLLIVTVFAGRLLDGHALASPAAANRRRLVVTGVLLGLLFLARTDQSFTVAACVASFAVADLVRMRRTGAPPSIGAWFALLAPIAVLAGGYLALNLVTTGHLMPVSGAAKVFYSEGARAKAVAEKGSLLAAMLPNVLGHPRIVLFGVAMPWVLLAARPFVRVLRENELLPRLVPVFAGLTASWVFYNTAFWPPYGYAPWYYVPHKFAAALCVAAAARAAWVLVTERAPAVRLALEAPNRQVIAGVGALLVALAVLGRETIATLVRPMEPQPMGWNSALYRTALWCREGVPAGKTIWAASAGILGYLSGHRVVNVDGLMNDFDFLENVLRGPPEAMGEYRSRWDYGIDAFVDADLELVDRLGWVDVTPPQLAVDVKDGRDVRHIRVFRMPGANKSVDRER